MLILFKRHLNENSHLFLLPNHTGMRILYDDGAYANETPSFSDPGGWRTKRKNTPFMALTGQSFCCYLFRMEESLFQFSAWVSNETERFYRVITAQENPAAYFIANTFSYHSKLAQAGHELLNRYRDLLTDQEQTELTARLQTFCEGSLDELARRLSFEA